MIYNNPKILLARSFAELVLLSHLITVQLVSFSEVQYFALSPVEFHSVAFGPVLHLIKVILNSVSVLGY